MGKFQPSQHDNDSEVLAIVSVLARTLAHARISENEPMFQNIITWMESEQSAELVMSRMQGIVGSAISEQARFSEQIIEASDFDDEAAMAFWLPILMAHIRIFNKTTVLGVREMIARGIKEGLDMRSIGKLILSVFDKATTNRALTIARTEILAAMNYASMGVYKFASVPYKSWFTNLDGRERDSHNAAHAQQVPLSDYFIVGGAQLMYPGDPSAPIDEIAGCRCSVLPEFKSDVSVWNETSMDAFLKAHLAMHDRFAKSLQDAVGLIFMEQKARVAGIIDQSLS